MKIDSKIQNTIDFYDQYNIVVNTPVGKIATAAIYKNEKDPIFLFLPGSGGTKERCISMQRFFAKNGFYTVSIDYLGRGESSGTRKDYDLGQESKDVAAVLRQIRKEKKNEKLYIYGTSRGAYDMAKIVKDVDPDFLILDAPAAYSTKEDRNPIPELGYVEITLPKINQENIFNTPGVIGIKEFAGNLLIIQHDDDEIIPKWITQAYFNNATNVKSKKIIRLSNMTHSTLSNQEYKDRVQQEISNWVSKIN